MRAYRYFAVLLVALCLGVVLHSTSLLKVDTGAFVSANDLTAARTGAASVLLPDGRVMILGGTSNGVATTSTEFFNQDGTFTPAPPMSVARTGAAAIWLPTGYVLVTGGSDGQGGYTNSAEVFDPLANNNQGAWRSLTSTIGDGRANHTMAMLSDGNILVVGGENAAGAVSSILTFNLSSEDFANAASLITGRTGAAVAAMPDGRVLIAGGADANGTPLASTEILTYDDTTGASAIAAGPAMSTARVYASATSTYDGVAVVGGNDGSNDLGSAEIYSQWQNAFRVVNGGAPRSHHMATLLPYNGSILVTGGTAGTASDLLQPWRNSTAGMFLAANASAINHDGGFVTPTGATGVALVGSGKGDAATKAELYGFATIATDKDDYAPGTTVVMTGSGFAPNEQVNLHLHEWVNQTSTDYPDYIAVADANGNLVYDGYAPTTSDLNSRYHLTAIGQTSGLQAQTVFTDAPTPTLTLTLNSGVTGAQVTVTSGGTPFTNGTGVTAGIYWDGSVGTTQGTLLKTCNVNNGGNLQSCSITVPASATVGPHTVVATQLTPDIKANSVAATFTVTPTNISTTTAVALSASSPTTPKYGDAVSLTATITPSAATGTVQFVVDSQNLGSPVTVSGGSATSISTTSLGAGNHTVAANFVGTGLYTDSSNSFTLSIAKADATINVTGYTGPYDGAAHGATGTATGVNGETLTGLDLGASFTDVPGGTATWTFTDVTGNYKGATSTVQISIGKADSTTVVTCGGPYTYNGTAQTPCTVSVTGPGGLNLSPTASYSNNTNAGVATASYSFAGDANHNASQDSKNFTIQQAPVTATAGSYSGVYNGESHAPSDCKVTGTYTGDLTCANNPASVGPDVDSGAVVPVMAGTGLSNFQVTSVNGTYSITQASSAVAVSCPASVTYNGTAQTSCTVSVTGVGGLNETPTPTYLNNTNAGTATASYTFDGDKNHTGNSDSKTFTIEKAKVTATAGSYSATYDGASHAPSGCEVTGSYTGDLTCANNPAKVGADVSSGDVLPVVSGTGLDNFEITNVNGSYKIDQATSTVTISCPTSVTYSGTAQTPCTVSVTGAGGLNLTPTPTYLNNTNAGTATASYTFDGDKNHTGNSDSKTFTIEKAKVTATAGSYDGTYTGATFPISGCIVNGGYTGGLTCSNTPDSVGPDAGSGTVTPNVTGDTTNFDVSLANGTWNIAKATSTTAVICPTSVTYNGYAQTPCTATVTGAGGLNQTLTITYSNNTHAGTAGANASYAGDSNHKESSDNKTFAINQAPVTATAGSYSGVYDALTHTVSACAVTGAYTGDLSCTNDVNVVGPAVASGVVIANVSGTNLFDFAVSKVNGSYSISERPITVKADPKFKYYGDADPALTYSISSGSLVGTDKFAGTLTRDAGEDVGQYEIRQGSVALNSNYALSFDGAKLTIGAWSGTGFYQPITMTPNGMPIIWNTVKAGSTIPLKFNLYKGNVELTNTSAVGTFTVAALPCGISALTDSIDFTTTGGTSLRYDTTAHQFIQNWQTPKSAAGGCYSVKMTAADQTTVILAYIQFK